MKLVLVLFVVNFTAEDFVPEISYMRAVGDGVSDDVSMSPTPPPPPKVRKEFPETWIWDMFNNLGSVNLIII